MFCKANQQKKTFFCAAIFDNFQTKMFKSETTSFPYFSPKNSESLKILDIRLREVGAKRRLNGTSKKNTHMDGQTDRRTFRLIESIGPDGRCFENCPFQAKAYFIANKQVSYLKNKTIFLIYINMLCFFLIMYCAKPGKRK